jgi:two-component system chemotaxis response regulator CheY
MSPRKKVLVIDDSRTVRRQVSSVLNEAGYDVVEAADGKSGVDMISSTDDLALVLCDVNMPQMNGVDLLAEVKSQPRNAELPILMMTVEGKPELMQRAKDAGATGWIVKPFNPAQFVATVNRLAR